jgi:phosphatidylserine decarboxylase
MSARFRRSLSLTVGWLADRRIPGPLRAPVYRTYARFTGADPSEAQLPLHGYASLGAFFVRRLQPGARPIDPSPDVLVAPCDGVVQALDRVTGASLLQAKGQSYRVRDLLAGAGEGVDLEGAWAWTIYLGPKDYHRVHAPLAGALVDVRWARGDRRSVAPGVLARKPAVLATNERAVLTLETALGPVFLVMVGALNVGRIRVVGVEPGRPPGAPLALERGAELARFEMGSTVVLVLPPERSAPRAGIEPGCGVRLGSVLADLHPGDPDG